MKTPFFSVYQTKKIQAFLSKSEFWSKPKSRHKKIQKAVFPGYLVVYENSESQHGLEILKTSGMVKILENEAIPIPEIQFESTKAILNCKADVSPFLYYAKGNLALVVDGTLKGCEGLLISIKKGEIGYFR